MNKNKPVKIGDILKNIIGDFEVLKKTGKQPEDIIKDNIPEKFLKHIKINHSIKEKVVINTENHQWLYELNKYKEIILNALQEEQTDVKVTELLFKVGKIK
ncbi:MAG: hypothetical protein ABH836_03075 [Candidatus Omnitrophota bacterium]